MAWTYDQTLAESKDQVRLLMGDNDPSDHLMQDEEIVFLLGQNDDNVYYAAADALETLASRFSRDVSKSADGLSISSSERWRSFQERAKHLRDQAGRARRLAIPYAGGIKRSEDDEHLTDNDLKPLHFGTGMHDHYEAFESDVTDSSNDPDTTWN